MIKNPLKQIFKNPYIIVQKLKLDTNLRPQNLSPLNYFEITKESVTLSLEGDVIQGDRFNIVVPFDNCNNFEDLASKIDLLSMSKIYLKIYTYISI